MVKVKRWSFREHMRLTDRSTWTTKDGRHIKVADMEDDHLVNTVHLLRRHAPAARIAALFSMVLGPRPSGDGATMAFESGIEELASMPVDEFLSEHCPPFRAMLRRYPAAEKRVYEKQRVKDEEMLADPWGNS